MTCEVTLLCSFIKLVTLRLNLYLIPGFKLVLGMSSTQLFLANLLRMPVRSRFSSSLIASSSVTLTDHEQLNFLPPVFLEFLPDTLTESQKPTWAGDEMTATGTSLSAGALTVTLSAEVRLNGSFALMASCLNSRSMSIQGKIQRIFGC